MTATATPPQVALQAREERLAWREREPGEAPPGPAANLERMNAAHAFRVAVRAELDALCADPKACDACMLRESCDRMLSALLIRLMNAVTEQAREETALMIGYRAEPRHAPAIAAHIAAHDRLINDLSAHVMDWGRRPPGEVRAAVSALLKSWNEVHYAQHDAPLLALAAEGAR